MDSVCITQYLMFIDDSNHNTALGVVLTILVVVIEINECRTFIYVEGSSQ